MLKPEIPDASDSRVALMEKFVTLSDQLATWRADRNHISELIANGEQQLDEVKQRLRSVLDPDQGAPMPTPAGPTRWEG